MIEERIGMHSLRAVPTLWLTLAFNLLTLWCAVALAFLAHADPAVWLPLASLVLCGAVGLVALARPQSRRFGVGCLGGTAVSLMVYAALLLVFFVCYFVIGGNELS
jgi:hypothetical protein